MTLEQGTTLGHYGIVSSLGTGKPTRIPLRRHIGSIVLSVLGLVTAAQAHPGSGIVVDAGGQVYFMDTGKGVWRIDAEGRLREHDGPSFHWMAIDRESRFAEAPWPSPLSTETERIGVGPTLILGGDFPLAVQGRDLYYPQLRANQRLQVIRFTSSGDRSVLATLPDETESGPLRWLNGMAAGADGAVYYTENRAVRRISADGALSSVVESLTVPACTPLPGLRPEQLPYLRGLDVATDGTVYVAASGCGALLRISPTGEVSVVLHTMIPWSPTAVAITGEELYVLEYWHPIEATEDRADWVPRVRRIGADGRAQTVAAVSRE